MSDDDYTEEELDAAIDKVRAEDGRTDPALEQTVKALTQQMEAVVAQHWVPVVGEEAFAREYARVKASGGTVLTLSEVLAAAGGDPLTRAAEKAEDAILERFAEGYPTTAEELRTVKAIMARREGGV